MINQEELKIINQISKDNEKNYSITENLFLSKIIELGNINLNQPRKKKNFILQYMMKKLKIVKSN